MELIPSPRSNKQLLVLKDIFTVSKKIWPVMLFYGSVLTVVIKMLVVLE